MPQENKPNEIPVPVDDAIIIVQSCDTERAHVFVLVGVSRSLRNRKSTVFNVSLPDLVREWRVRYYNELDTGAYDRILRENKDTLLRTIDQLNKEVITP
jgi:hypothetical protein